MGMAWTDERIEMLRKLFDDGLSAAQIANELACGLSRNAVIGKAHRLGLSRPIPARKNVPKRPRRTAPKAHFGSVIKAKKRALTRDFQPRAESFVPAVTPMNLDLMDLSSETCKWPYGDGMPFTFCGHPVKSGSPYCPSHKAMAYSKPQRKTSEEFFAGQRSRQRQYRAEAIEDAVEAKAA